MIDGITLESQLANAQSHSVCDKIVAMNQPCDQTVGY